MNALSAFRTVAPRRRLAAAAAALLLPLALACASSDGGGTPAATATRQPAAMPTAVNFEAETFNHGLFSLAASEGRPVVVHFWYPSCPPCEAEALRLQTAYDRHSGDVDFVAVQQTKLDSAAAGAAFVERLGITYPVFADRDDLLGIYYNVSDFPSTVFLDRQHRVHRNVSGTINATELERLVQEVAGS